MFYGFYLKDMIIEMVLLIIFTSILLICQKVVIKWNLI